MAVGPRGYYDNLGSRASRGTYIWAKNHLIAAPSAWSRSPPSTSSSATRSRNEMRVKVPPRPAPTVTSEERRKQTSVRGPVPVGHRSKAMKCPATEQGKRGRPPETRWKPDT